MFRWKTTAAVAVTAAALVLTGCSGSTSGSDSGSGGTLILGAITPPTTFDPAGSEWGNRSPFYQAVFDTLLVATADGEIVPSLATSYEYNDDNTVLTLKIRDDVTFTDKSKLTADVVKQNLERFKTGTSPDAGYFAGVASVEAPDDTTVVITLSAPDPAMLNYLTRDPGLIASAESFDSPDLATNPVGSGPYVLDTAATVTGTSYSYTANPDYWNKDWQHYDKLTINVLQDATAGLNAVKSGEVNGIKLANNDNLAEVEGAGWTVNANELDFQGMLLLDRAGTMNPAIADVRVRQAINYAFDKESLLKAIGQGYGTPTTQIFPTSSEGYDESLDDDYPYDPEKAKELLAEAGYPDGFELNMPSSSLVGSSTFTLIQQQLSEVGITVTYTDAGNNFIADVLAPKYAATWLTLQQDPDWALINFELSPNAIFNPFKNADPELETLIEAVRTADESGYAAAVQAVNAYTVENAWFAPWYRQQSSFVTDANTKVETQTGNAYPYLWNITPA